MKKIPQNVPLRTAHPFRLAAVLLIAIVAALALCLRFRHKPILLHVLAETGCACGDFHDEVTGIIFRNPFRDRSPENSADRFFRDLRDGKCDVDQALCGYALGGHQVSAWRFVNREDHGGHAVLYYKLAHKSESGDAGSLTGEGAVEVIRNGNEWKVSSYSSYF